MSLMDLSIVIKAIDNASKTFKKISDNVNIIGKSANEVGNKFSNVTKEAGLLAGKLSLLTGAAIWGFKSQFIDTSAEFEKFTSVLKTLEGSSIKAKASMNWVSDFAAKTPYELSEVTEAFVKLKSYGMEPMNGLLTSLGNTSAAMGKPIMQAVEAIADAVTGENERLKEFGIRATVQGNKIRYEYAYNGRQMVKEADKNSRAMIEATLTSIFNQKYKGAMNDQSKTWNGLISNISDQWTRFKNMIMQAGAFDYLKNKLQLLLGKIDEMAKSGQLKVLADQLGKNLVTGLKDLWKIGKAVYPLLAETFKLINGIVKTIGYKNTALLGFGIMLIKPTMSIISFGKSIFDLVSKFKFLFTGLRMASVAVWGFTASLLANPITWVVVGVAALAGAAYLIYKNWKPISAFFKNMWSGIVNFMSSIKDRMFTAGANIIKSLWEGMKSLGMKPVQEIAKIAQAIRNHLPFSPAKVGALRDIHKIRLIETIASNIKPYPMVEAMNKALRVTRQSIQPKTLNAGLSYKTSNQSNSSNFTVYFSPNITIQGGNNLNEEALMRSLRNRLLPEFEKLMRDFPARERRLAF